MHIACTEFLTALHTGDRTKEAIDTLNALTQLFTTGPWLPAAIRPG